MISNALLDKKVQPTRVIMNPPFSSSALKNDGKSTAKGKSKYGYNHLKSALQRLTPGGRLVAVMGGGTELHHDQGASLTAPTTVKMWQDLAKEYHLRANVRIAGKEYAKNGTTFGTRVIVIDKTGPTPGANWLEQIANIEHGDYDTVEQAWAAIGRLASGPEKPADVAPTPGRREGAEPADAPADGQQGSGASLAGDSGSVQPGAPGGTRSAGEDGAEGTGKGRGAGAGEPVASGRGSTGSESPQVHPGVDAQRDGGEQPAQPEPAGRPTPASAPSGASAPQRADDLKPKTREEILEAAKAALKPLADAARKRLQDKMRGVKMTSGIDPQDLIDLATIGAEYVLDGAITFKKWSARAMAEMGDVLAGFTDHLRQIHEMAQELAEERMSAATARRPTAAWLGPTAPVRKSPRAGSDGRGGAIATPESCFNPRPPRGERPPLL
jgi:hypothetical protein